MSRRFNIVALPFGYFRNYGAENRNRTDIIQFLVRLLDASYFILFLIFSYIIDTILYQTSGLP